MVTATTIIKQGIHTVSEKVHPIKHYIVFKEITLIMHEMSCCVLGAMALTILHSLKQLLELIVVIFLYLLFQSKIK